MPVTPRPRTLPKLETGLPKVDDVLRRLAVALETLMACPLLYGVLLSGKAPDIGGATVELRHNLGRVPVGWFHVAQTDGSQLVRTAADETTITFEQGTGASVDTPFTLWVF